MLESAKQLTGFRDFEFWTRVVLQATETDPCVRHAVVAIGALDFKMGMEIGVHENIRQTSICGTVLEAEAMESTVRHPVELMEKSRLEFAYREYGKALSSLRHAVAAQKTNTRTSLIASMLFACFETYHGNIEIATAQVFAGLDMIEQYSKNSKLLKANNMVSPPPLESDILESFAIMEIQSAAWGDKRSSALHLERLRVCEDAQEDIPTEFRNLRHAQSIQNLLVLRSIHLKLAYSNIDTSFSQGSLSEGLPNASIITLDCQSHASDPPLDKAQNLLATFRQWRDAFKPYLQQAQRPQASRKDFLYATMLQMQYLSCYLWTASSSQPTHMWYRSYTKELHEAVDVVKTIYVANNENFSLDSRVVLPLICVGWFYRHRAMRKEVIDICARIPRREAMWDALMVGKIMQYMSEVEEEGLDEEEEYVPEEKMTRMSDVRCDAVNRSVFVQLTHGVKSRPGEAVIREKTLHVSTSPSEHSNFFLCRIDLEDSQKHLAIGKAHQDYQAPPHMNCSPPVR